ncbi:MAG TPA: hypothetical protein VFC21_00745 [Bryobacteraceae bacterium]|nr:hypothetical protein [Bryobacteraceae bacterium]
MKTLIAILALMCAGVLSAQTSDTTTPGPKKKAAKTAVAKKATPPVAQPVTIPADATPNADGTYAYTDKAGKKWTYTRTPFGISKIEDVGPGSTGGFTTIPKEQLTKTTDNGDTVKFQRQTPFGTTNWEKKKSEMTDEERHIFESQQAKP